MIRIHKVEPVETFEHNCPYVLFIPQKSFDRSSDTIHRGTSAFTVKGWSSDFTPPQCAFSPKETMAFIALRP
jgi:hypothetical protein